MRMKENKIALGNLVFDDLAEQDAAERVIEAAKKQRGVYVVTPNAAMAHNAFTGPDFAAVLEGAFLSLADGVGITGGARFLNCPFENGRVRGVSLGMTVASLAAAEGLPLYLLGGKEGVAAKAAEKLKEKYPALLIAGTQNGYFADREKAVIEGIAHSPARLLFCCLGSPLQERFAAACAKQLSLPILCLGGSLDIYAENKHLAPRAVRAMGCEWLWRTLAEPSRFRRLPALFAFVWDLARLKTKKGLALCRTKGYNSNEL